MSEAQVGKRVSEAVGELRNFLRAAPTEDVVGQCISDNIAAANALPAEHHLSSPAKQQAFLLSILLGTPEPIIRRKLDRESWGRVYECLQDAFLAYMDLFWPNEDELRRMSAEWHRTREVAIGAFLHYFNTGLLASSEQVRARIKRYVTPFDDVLHARWGVSASAALEISAWIHERFAEGMDAALAAHQRVDAIRRSAERMASERGLGPHHAIEIAREEFNLAEAAEEYLHVVRRVASVRPSEIVSEFRIEGGAYVREFFVGRGDLPQIDFPTEQYPWEAKAGVHCGEDRVLIPSVNGVYRSLLTSAERELEQSGAREAYLRHRDRQLEDEVEAAFSRICHGAELFRNLYETPDNHFEHDLVVRSGGKVLVVEAKAAPPVEAFRDPDRAFQRLMHSFRSSSGIQHGFEQAARVRRRLMNGEVVVLYEADGSSALTLRSADVDAVMAVCATRDDFGPLGTNLSLLLEKDEGEPYPWVVNVLDLDAMADAWEYLSWSAEELWEFLKWRVKCHGKVWGSDELEFVGCHIRHGSLKPVLQASADLVPLNPSYSNFFDELYAHLYLDGPPPDTEIVDPVMTDLRPSLRAGQPVFVEEGKRAVGRNEPCPCGSGKKFKKCCWRHLGGRGLV